jgi:Family of unknown function (DUF6161)
MADGLQKRIGELETLYNEKLALRAPAEYWDDKATHHERRGRLWGFLVGLCFVIGGTAVIVLANALLNDTRPPLWRIAAVGLLATLVVWITRLFVRVMLSHLHLATDAAERVV